jgi:hypothetical protein
MSLNHQTLVTTDSCLLSCRVILLAQVWSFGFLSVVSARLSGGFEYLPTEIR